MSDETEQSGGKASPSLTCYALPATVGQRLRWVRRRSKMTIDEVVAKAGVSKGNYSKLENGQIENPGVYTMARICQNLGMTLEELYLA